MANHHYSHIKQIMSVVSIKQIMSVVSIKQIMSVEY